MDTNTPSYQSKPWKCTLINVRNQVEIRGRCKSPKTCPWATVTPQVPVPMKFKDRVIQSWVLWLNKNTRNGHEPGSFSYHEPPQWEGASFLRVSQSKGPQVRGKKVGPWQWQTDTAQSSWSFQIRQTLTESLALTDKFRQSLEGTDGAASRKQWQWQWQIERHRWTDRLEVLGRDKDTAAMVRMKGGSSVLSSAQRFMEFLPLGTVL